MWVSREWPGSNDPTVLPQGQSLHYSHCPCTTLPASGQALHSVPCPGQRHLPATGPLPALCCGREIMNFSGGFCVSVPQKAVIPRHCEETILLWKMQMRTLDSSGTWVIRTGQDWGGSMGTTHRNSSAERCGL